MEWFLTFATLFLTGGLSGWVIELFFRRFISQKKWVNPGFLTGPFLPLYGFGLCGFYLFTNLIPWEGISSNASFVVLLKVVCMGLSMTLTEYLAGLIFIKGMKVKLWDYSNRWGNVQGIICPLFSLLWTVIGIIYMTGMNSFFLAEVSFVLAHQTLFALLWGICFGIMSVDVGWSVGLVTKIRKAVHDRRMVVDWDKIKLSFQEHYRKTRQTPEWFFAFKTKKEEFNALMNEYIAMLQREMALRQENYLHRQEEKRAKQLARLERHQEKKNAQENENEKEKKGR